MEKALQNRLTYGPLMLGGLFLLLWLDAAIERWTQPWMSHFHHATGVPAHGLGGVGILALLLLIIPIATDELAVLFTAEQVRPYRVIAIFGAGAIIVHGFLTQLSGFRVVAASTLAFIIVFVMLLAALRRAMERQVEQAIVRMAGTVLTTLYLGGLGWFLMAIRVKHSERLGGFTGSTTVVLMILLVVKFTDIGAYFGGRALGRNKLIPWLSPGKTREGLACGMLLAGIVGGVCAHFVPLTEHLAATDSTKSVVIYLNFWQGFVFGAVLGGIGQVGDLLESLMKRDAQVKDSGRIIPGFGGILDVIDSPLLAAPFAYLLFSLFGLATLS